MTCTEAFYLIQRHYDGELSTEEQQILNRHLASCADCQQEFDDYGGLFGDIAALVTQVEHRDVLSETLGRMAEAKGKRRRDWLYRVAAVAASVLVISSYAFLSLTETGQSVSAHVAGLFEGQAVKQARAEAAREQAQLEASLNVENNHEAAQYALTKIRQQVTFPLLEPQHEQLRLVGTRLLGGDETAAYQLVELTYKARSTKGGEDTLYLIATPDASLKSRAISYLGGSYQFRHESQFGPFLWAAVGEHAVTAEINGIFYQLFSPFLSIQELGVYAGTMKRMK